MANDNINEAAAVVNPIELINMRYPSLTKTQKRISDFIVGNANEISYMTLTEFCEAVDITAVTAGRYATTLGYKNYAELNKDVKIYLQSLISPKKNSYKEFDINDYDKNKKKRIHSIVEDEKNNVIQSLNHLSDETMLFAADMMIGARKVYIAACGTSEPVGEMLYYRLLSMDIEVEILHTKNTPLLASQMNNITKDDVLIIFSFPNYGSTATNIIKIAKSKQAKAICLSDSYTGPASCFCDIVILCQTSNQVFLNSMTVPASVCLILATMIFWEKSGEIKEREEEFNNIYERLGETDGVNMT